MTFLRVFGILYLTRKCNRDVCAFVVCDRRTCMDLTENPKLSSLLRWVAKTVGRLMTNGGPWRVTIHGNGGMDIKAEFTVYETIM